MKLYKLTDEKDRTYGGCQWGEGVEHAASGAGYLCGSGWLHAYTDPLLAIFMNPMHRYFDQKSCHLWEAEGDVGKEDHGLKVGCTRLRTVKRVDPPEVTFEQHLRFAILCAMRICKNKAWRNWAEKWLSGEDRSKEAADVIGKMSWATRNKRLTNETDAMCDAALAVESEWAIPAHAVFYAAWAAKAAGTSLPLAEIAREAVQGGA